MDLQKGIKTMVHFIWPVVTEKPFFTSSDQSRYILGHVRIYAMPYPISWIILILDSESTYKLLEFRWVQSAPPVADLFLYWYEKDFVDSLNHDNQADVIEAFPKL